MKTKPVKVPKQKKEKKQGNWLFKLIKAIWDK